MEPKHILLSRTVQGLILILLGHLGPRVGITADTDSLGRILEELFTVGGLAWALYGRIKAEKPLRFRSSGSPETDKD